MKRSALFAGAALVIACGGGSYYIVQNPTTGQTYYTNKYETLDNGAIKLTDAKTQQTVTLPTSSVQKVDESEYNAKLHAAQANPPPTAPAATPASN